MHLIKHKQAKQSSAAMFDPHYALLPLFKFFLNTNPLQYVYKLATGLLGERWGTHFY